MDVLSTEEMAAKLDYRRPLKPEPEVQEGLWCIPFEYGENSKGTRISPALAKTIAAELRAHIAEWEKRELRRAFDQEKKRAEELGRQSSEARTQLFDANQEIAALKRALHKKKTKGFR